MNTMTEPKCPDKLHTGEQSKAPLAQPLALDEHERQRCEVWTRVMGYHRPVASFNIGKKAEHAERRFFVESRAAAHC